MHTRVIKLFCVHALSMELGHEYHLMIKNAYVKFQINIVVSEKEAPHSNFKLIKGDNFLKIHA